MPDFTTKFEINLQNCELKKKKKNISKIDLFYIVTG